MMPVEFDVTGKVVFITGAGRGIGKGIAQVLAEAGADIALNALTPRYVESTAAEIAAASGRRVVPVIADVTKPDEVRRAVDSVLATFGCIDVLVNALGDSIRKPLVTLARRSGKVINIASWTAHQGGRDMVLYTTAKTALAGFTRAQALEWAPYGVQINAIAPGLFPDVVTAGEERFRQLTQRAEQTVPLGRAGRLREVGLLALYLASDASDYMTGQTILLDGGLGL